MLTSFEMLECLQDLANDRTSRTLFSCGLMRYLWCSWASCRCFKWSDDSTSTRHIFKGNRWFFDIFNHIFNSDKQMKKTHFIEIIRVS